MAVVESTQARFNTIGTLGANRTLPLLRGLIGAAVFLLPGIVGIYCAEEINARASQTIATAVVNHQAVVGGALAEQRDGAAGVALVDVFLQQIECFRCECSKHVGSVAGQIVGHAATHGEAGGVDAFHIDIGHFLNIFHNRFGKGYVVDRTVVGATGSDVPCCVHTGRCHQNKAFLVGDTAVSGIDFLAAVAAQAVEAQHQGNVSISGVAVRYVQVVRPASAAHGNGFLAAGRTCADQIPGRT